ncbi:MAG: PHP domain-containing protein [Clostridiales Family XIII bacterium]|jgi:putative hydrolase|nr:PHP domain-containing protein [Clostridiales Family XIII bacterium]
MATIRQVEIMINGKRYSLNADMHTHTTFSHGLGSIEDNVLAARNRNIHTIAITDHGPGHYGYGIRRRDIPKMRREINRLSVKYPDMEILLGVEANILGRGKIDIKRSEYRLFDFICAGYHYGALGGGTPAGVLNAAGNYMRSKPEKASKAMIKKNTKAIVDALLHNPIKFLTHPGDKAPVDLLEIAVVCAKVGTYIELNTLHASLTSEDIKTMALADVKFIVSSDAHSPDRVGDFLSAVNLLIEAGISMDRVVNVTETPEPSDSNSIG